MHPGIGIETGNANPATGLIACGSNEFLTLILGDEEYGMDIFKVQEIRGYAAVTPITLQ